MRQINVSKPQGCPHSKKHCLCHWYLIILEHLLQSICDTVLAAHRFKLAYHILHFFAPFIKAAIYLLTNK